MNAVPCIEEFPYRLEITDLTTEKKDMKYVKTKEEVETRLKDNDADKTFVAGWDRQAQSLIGMTHEDIV